MGNYGEMEWEIIIVLKNVDLIMFLSFYFIKYKSSILIFLYGINII